MTYCKPQDISNDVRNKETNKVAEFINSGIEEKDDEEILETAHRSFRPLFLYRMRQIQRNGNRNGNRNRNGR